jgi:hypothetical protein
MSEVPLKGLVRQISGIHGKKERVELAGFDLLYGIEITEMRS